MSTTILRPLDPDSVPVTVSKGFMGNPEHWCFWESEYPEDGACGPFDTLEEALSVLAKEMTGCVYHVEKVIDTVP